MQRFSLDPSRSRTIRALGGNPLLRTSDRIEALVVLAAVVVALIAAPIAGAAGTAAHDARSRAYTEQAQHRHLVTATVTNPGGTTVRPYLISSVAQVRWRTDGIDHVGAVPRDEPTKAGDRVDVWVDDRGDVTSSPGTALRAVVDSFGIALALWLGAVAAAAAVVAFARYWLNRARRAEWDREIGILVGHDGGRTNRPS
jgi:hypothetical protein